MGKDLQAELKDLLLIVPKSFAAAINPSNKRDVNEIPPIDDEETYKPVLYSIASVLVFKALCGGLTKNGTIKMMIDIHKGDTVKAAASLSMIQSLGALLEFAIGPYFGNLSDIYGRKFVMSLNPIVVFAHYLLLLTNPKSLWAHYTKVPVIAIETTFYATMRAMMADVMSGQNIAENGYINMAPAGLAIVVAPLVAIRLSTRQNLMLATALSGAACWIVLKLQETLPPKSRMAVSELDLASCNPFAFTRLFTNGHELAALSLISGVQTCTDPRLMDEVSTLVMRDKLQWGDKRVQGQLALMSASSIMGVPAGKYSVRTLGRLGHTHFAHFFKFMTYVLWGRANNSRSMRMTQLVHIFGQRQRDGIETLITDLGATKGLGRGQVESYKYNWRSISNLLAPLCYSRLFAVGKANGNPGLPFVGAAAFVATAELLMVAAVDKKRLQRELSPEKKV
jgi:MFS family permease